MILIFCLVLVVGSVQGENDLGKYEFYFLGNSSDVGVGGGCGGGGGGGGSSTFVSNNSCKRNISVLSHLSANLPCYLLYIYVEENRCQVRHSTIDTCYWVDTRQRSWTDAYTACNGYGGELAVISSETILNKILQLNLG